MEKCQLDVSTTTLPYIKGRKYEAIGHSKLIEEILATIKDLTSKVKYQHVLHHFISGL